MNKKILLVVIVISILFLSIPFTLYILTDKEELQKQNNLKNFDSFILNINMCLYGNSKKEADYEYIVNNCDYLYNCEDISYKDNNLTLKNCIVNNQIFSYINGEVISN